MKNYKKSQKNSNLIYISNISSHTPYSFDRHWHSDELKLFLDILNLNAFSKLSIKGALRPMENRNWHLVAQVKAHITQSCIITLNDLEEHIDTQITRKYIENFDEIDESETSEEILNTEIEPIPDHINLRDIAVETVSLAMNDYPRTPNTSLELQRATPKGAAPLTNKSIKPFASLEKLRDKMNE